MKKHARLTAKSYLVGIPVPYLDRNGQKLDRSLTATWTKKTLLELTECFGGATPLSAPATNRVGENILFEEGQTLVLSGCDDRDEYLLKRDRIQEFAERMGVALNQYSVFVLAFPSDSFLLEIAVTRKTRKKT